MAHDVRCDRCKDKPAINPSWCVWRWLCSSCQGIVVWEDGELI